MTVKPLETLYFCPGEQHPISRSVHLSRLAAFYPKCRNCPLRTDTGQLPQTTVQRLQSTERRVERKSLFTAEGVRGVYLNELTRRRAGQLASGFADWLWDQSPLLPRPNRKQRGLRPSRPTVIVGQDERPSSADLVTGAAAALRHMGCQVIDIGLTTKSCFWFAVDHLEAAGGMFVTGAGCDPSWNGIDFVGRDGIPYSHTGTLKAIESRMGDTYSRPTREAGRQRTFQASVPYAAGLWKHFHALRPLKVCCASPIRQVQSLLRRIFETLPCQLIPLDVPQRIRDFTNPDDADVRRVGAAVQTHQAHLGVLIDDDGQRCAFFDEQGTLLASAEILRLIAGVLLLDHPGKAIVLESSSNRWKEALQSAGGKVIVGGDNLEGMSRSLRTEQAILGGGDSGRFWFHETIPTCDAILTLARVLDALSRSDAPFSEAVASLSSR